ncbi:MAG: UvrD-helicase domain-containing protein [Flavobacteriaceae bacterium]|nr:UvrD-helicase domain-containing protein [Flavobacteriaceae bacterium]
MQQPSTFKVYNASAGSGKTFTLVKEYLKIVLQSEDKYKFQQILAITFTNKAAAEMKARVLKNLQEFSEGNANDILDQILKETSLSEAVIVQRSSLIIEAILQNYSAFYITTIDSFTHKIIKSFAFDLGLNVNFEVELDSETLLQQAVDVLISKIGIEKEVTNTLIDYALDKVKEDKSWDISNDLNEFASILLNDDDAVHFKKLRAKNLEHFTALKKKLIAAQKQTEKQFETVGKEALAIIEKNGLQHHEFSYSGELPKHFIKLTKYKFLNAEDLKFNGRLDATIEESKNLYAAKTDASSKQIIEEIKEELVSYYYASKELYTTKNATYWMQKLMLKSIIPLAVLTKINAELIRIKEENNIQLISEFNQLIANNIKGEPAPFIYERIGQKFKHYFIDEMQDTSVLQWQNLVPLIDNMLAQENSDLLLVGDGKQAIYRWRGGKAEQFIELGSEEQDTYQANPFQIQKETKALHTNYRSFSEIINFNNAFFQFVANYFQNKKYQKLFIDGNKQQVTDKEGGFVAVDFLEKQDEENELKFAKKVHEIIVRLDKDFSRNEVCVLVRKKQEGIEVANYLSENGIKVVSSETLLLQNSSKVNFIINLLQVIQHPKDDPTWVELLYFLHHHFAVTEDLHSFIKSVNLKKQHSFFEKLKAYKVSFSLRKFNQLPFYEKIELIIREFRLLNSSDAYVQFFLDVVFEQQKKGKDVQQFLDYWNAKKEKLSIVAPEAEDAVQIMTIHKSKGLEFPVVIFPYDIDIYQQIQPKAWLTDLPSEQFEGFEELLVSSHKSIRFIGNQGENIYQQQREELELDNFNLLYVALTRAVEQLYVITEKTNTNRAISKTSGVFIEYLQKENFWLADKLSYSFGNQQRIGKKETQKNNTLTQQKFISNSWNQHSICMVANASKRWDTEQEHAIAYGNLVHEMLSKIYVSGDVETIIERYRNQGLINVTEVDLIRNILIEIVTHPALKNYYKKDVIVFNERELVTAFNEILIPDRLVFNQRNEAVIIDYKTGKPLKEHHQQVKKYAEILEKMKIKVLKKILIYIDNEILIEEV